MLCRLVSMTVRSRDPSEFFDFPWLDFPLFFAMVGGRFPGPLGAISLGPALFIVSPKKRSISNRDSIIRQPVLTESDLRGHTLYRRLVQRTIWGSTNINS